jgi:hypothetical protein
MRAPFLHFAFRILPFQHSTTPFCGASIKLNPGSNGTAAGWAD